MVESATLSEIGTAILIPESLGAVAYVQKYQYSLTPPACQSGQFKSAEPVVSAGVYFAASEDLNPADDIAGVGIVTVSIAIDVIAAPAVTDLQRQGSSKRSNIRRSARSISQLNSSQRTPESPEGSAKSTSKLHPAFRRT